MINYTEPSEAQLELGRRNKDKKLAADVLDYLGGALPNGWPENGNIATINRYIATARVEDIVFTHAAASIGMKPFWPTYHEESFKMQNPEKVSCLRPRVQLQKQQISRSWLVANPTNYEGQAIGSIQVGDESLQTVHSRARDLVLGQTTASNTFDISEWNISQAARFGWTDGRLAPHYYHAVMGLYICHGVLFEDFDSGPNNKSGLSDFVSYVVEPAVKSIKRLFGLEPIIVRLPYIVGFLDYPGACDNVFGQVRQGISKGR